MTARFQTPSLTINSLRIRLGRILYRGAIVKRFRVLSAVASAAAFTLVMAAPAGADIVSLDPDTDDIVETTGSVARVSGTFVCTGADIGLSVRVTASVIQGNVKLTGSSGKGTCTGGTQTFSIVAYRVQGPALLAGTATVEATAQSGTPHESSSDITKASEIVVTIIP